MGDNAPVSPGLASTNPALAAAEFTLPVQAQGQNLDLCWLPQSQRHFRCHSHQRAGLGYSYRLLPHEIPKC